jgi:hypothetical protein
MSYGSGESRCGLPSELVTFRRKKGQGAEQLLALCVQEVLGT